MNRKRRKNIKRRQNKEREYNYEKPLKVRINKTSFVTEVIDAEEEENHCYKPKLETRAV